MTESTDKRESNPLQTGNAAPVTNGRRRPRKRVIAVILIILLIVGGLVFGLPYVWYAMAHESTNDAFIEGDVVLISSRVAGHVDKIFVKENQRVAAGDVLAKLDDRDYQARADAAEAALASAQAKQRTHAITVELTTINTGSMLDQAQADVEATAAAVEAAKASAKAASSQYDAARAQLASAQASLAEAQADVQVAEAEHRRESADLKRYREMVKSDTISEQQLDHATAAEAIAAGQLAAAKGKVQTRQANVAASQAAVQVAQNMLKQSQAHVTTCQAQAAQAQARLRAAQSAPKQVAYSQSQLNETDADVKAAEAELEQAKLNVSYTTITAPCAGYVTRKAVEEGQYVQVGQSMLAVVSSNVWVKANFKETQLTDMRVDQPVLIEVDAYPGVKFTGRVQSMQRGTGARFSLLPPENATGNYVKVVQRVPVKIVFDDGQTLKDYMLAPGMSVVPYVDIRKPGNLPATASASQITQAEQSGQPASR